MKTIKPNYLVIAGITILTSWVGSRFTMSGMQWYKEIIERPSWIFPDWVFGTVWTALYVLTALAAMLVWNSKAPKEKRISTIAVFTINAFLNAFWSYVFFVRHSLTLAVWEAGLLALSIVLMIALSWNISRKAAWLLLPYLAWTMFATYLSYVIVQINTL